MQQALQGKILDQRMLAQAHEIIKFHPEPLQPGKRRSVFDAGLRIAALR